MTVKILKKAADTNAPATVPQPSPTPSSAPGASAPRVRPLVPPRAPKSAKNSTRVLLTCIDGKIEWDKMTIESRKAFEDLFKNKDFLSQFGLSGKEKIFEPEQMKALYDGISMMYQTVIGMFLKWPAPALKLLAYTEDQKNLLAGPTANLASKFAPAILVKHQELFIWGSLFATVTQANFMRAKVEAQKVVATKPAPVITAGRAPAAPAPADRPAPTIAVPFVVPPIVGGYEGASLEG